MTYYEHTTSEIRKELDKIPPDRFYADTGPTTAAHLLWMCDQITAMDTSSVRDAAKAGRWIGWILAQVEVMGLWQNCNSQDLVRVDVLAGADRPVA